MTATRASLMVLMIGLGALRCSAKSDPDPLVERAAFGVFFGGQIQDRKQLAFELDPAQQSTGFRIDFRAPLKRAVQVSWEIARPLGAHARPADAGADQVVEVGQVVARVGETRLDVPVLLRRGQALGAWHVRVKVDARVVLERDVQVFDVRALPARERGGGT